MAPRELSHSRGPVPRRGRRSFGFKQKINPDRGFADPTFDALPRKTTSAELLDNVMMWAPFGDFTVSPAGKSIRTSADSAK